MERSYKVDIPTFDHKLRKFEKVTEVSLYIDEKRLTYTTKFIAHDPLEDEDGKEVVGQYKDEPSLYDQINTAPRFAIMGTQIAYSNLTFCDILYVNVQGWRDDIVLHFEKRKDALAIEKIILDWLLFGTIPPQPEKK